MQWNSWYIKIVLFPPTISSIWEFPHWNVIQISAIWFCCETRGTSGTAVDIHLDKLHTSTYLTAFDVVSDILRGSGATGMKTVYRNSNRAPNGWFTCQICFLFFIRLLLLKLLFAVLLYVLPSWHSYNEWQLSPLLQSSNRAFFV